MIKPINTNQWSNFYFQHGLSTAAHTEDSVKACTIQQTLEHTAH